MVDHLSREELDIDLQKYLLVLKRRWLPGVCVLGTITILATLFALVRDPTYQASGKVLIRLDRTPSLTGLDVPGTSSIGEPNAIGLQSDPIATEVETILSLTIAEEVIAELDLNDDAGEPLRPEDFFKVLEVKPIPGTDMIRISYEDSDPEIAATIVNKTIEVYRDNNVATKQAEAIAAREFIAKQLPNTEAAVRQAETALRQFKEQNQVIVLDEESRETVKAIQQLETDIAQTRAQLATATARSGDLQRRLGMSSEGALQATALSQSLAIQDTFTQIRQVQSQLDLARARYRDTHPTVTTLERQESTLQERLQNRVAQAIGVQANVPERGLQLGVLEQELTANLVQSEVERVSLMGRINELTRVQAAQRSRANVFPRLEATQGELERRLTIAQSTYETLLQRLQEVQVAQNQTIDNIRVVSQALAPEKPSSSKKLIVAAGFLVGSILGVMVAFAIDLCDRSVKTVREAKELLNLPILGIIPTAATASWKDLDSGRSIPTVVKGDDPESNNMIRAYRMLQANLSFVSANTRCQTIVISSAVSREGKSQVAANLALSMAQAGTRVLLVDADWRQPIQHHIWGCRNQIGLAQVLEQTVDLDDALQTVASNVSLLPAGNHPHQALTIFNAKQLQTFIDQASQRFDMILFDTPPLTQTADASTLGTLTDGTLLVVRLGLVEAADINAAKGLLRLSGQPVLGLVVNGVERTSNPNQYFAYTSNQSTILAPHQHLSPKLTTAENLNSHNGKEPASTPASLLQTPHNA